MKECTRCKACADDTIDLCPFDGTPLETRFDGPPLIDGKYRLDRRIGQGGMGAVYQATHVGLQRSFALKLIHPTLSTESAFAERFALEARALGRLRHPNIVEVTDYGRDSRGNGIHYIVMEYLQGTTLDDCGPRGAMPVAEALPILEMVAEAVDHAHRQGILHRDLKPSNVFLTGPDASAPASREVKVVDFGIARIIGDATSKPVQRHGQPTPDVETQAVAVEVETQAVAVDEKVAATGDATWTVAGAEVGRERLTGRGEVLGTLPYMAPEVLGGHEATAAADIYGFGVLAYEVLAGRRPFSGDAKALVQAHLTQAAPAPSDVNPALGPELDRVLLAALAKNPEARPPTALALTGLLRAAWRKATLRQWRARQVPLRTLVAVSVGIAVSAAVVPLSRLEPLRRLEGWTIDARFTLLGARPPDPRILLLTVDEASLAAAPAPLADRAAEFGRVLSAVYGAGARAVAIDFVLPDRWNQSREFSELVLRHADTLTLAALSSPAGHVLGTGSVQGLVNAALGPERTSGLFGFVNLKEDVDGVGRRARLRFSDAAGGVRDAWAGRVARAAARPGSTAGLADEIWIDHSIDWTRLARLSWRDTPTKLSEDADFFRDRLVLVGGEFVGSGDDYHRVPKVRGRPNAVSGLVMQAVILNTILSETPVRDVGALLRWGIPAALSMLTVLSLLTIRRTSMAWSMAGVFMLVAWGGLTTLFVVGGQVGSLTSVTGAGLISVAFGSALRRWLSPFAP